MRSSRLRSFTGGQRSRYNLYAWRERAWKSRLYIYVSQVALYTLNNLGKIGSDRKDANNVIIIIGSTIPHYASIVQLNDYLISEKRSRPLLKIISIDGILNYFMEPTIGEPFKSLREKGPPSPPASL